MTVLASVDDYLPDAGSLDRALLPLGFVLAFCAQHGLLSQTFLQHRGEQLSSVRLQEGPVTALFAVHGGTLYASDFSPRGVQFLQNYLPRLPQDFAELFGEDCYGIKDDWSNYQRLANVMIRQLLGQPRPTNLWRSFKTKLAGLWR
ncbi:MAG: hypothetical protein ISQ65_01535 [Pseudomonadales bacterium]|nr:hypothetical protein [Pseudomonadales bacterium]